jgi:hypothetical protein
MARTAWLCFTAVLLALAGLSEPPATFTAEMARKLIGEVGVAKAAAQISNDSATLEAVASGVTGAGADWLDVGTELLGAADGYLKDRLLQSFNYALLRDATAVLARGAGGVPVPAVCGYDPFAALDDPPKRSEFVRAVEQRERAVEKVKRPELAGAKATCLSALTELRSSGASRYEP